MYLEKFRDLFARQRSGPEISPTKIRKCAWHVNQMISPLEDARFDRINPHLYIVLIRSFIDSAPKISIEIAALFNVFMYFTLVLFFFILTFSLRKHSDKFSELEIT